MWCAAGARRAESHRIGRTIDADADTFAAKGANSLWLFQDKLLLSSLVVYLEGSLDEDAVIALELALLLGVEVVDLDRVDDQIVLYGRYYR